MKFSKRTRISLLLFCIALSLCFLFPRESKRDLKQIKSDGTLCIITSDKDADCSLPDDSTICFHQEIAKILADSLGLKLKITVCNNLEDAKKQLQQGECDIIAQAIPLTSSLPNDFLFSKPFVFNKQVLVKRPNDTINTQTELARQTVYVCTNSPAILRLNNLAEDIGDSIFIKESDLSEKEMIEKVKKGEINRFVCDFRTARQYADTLSYDLVIGFSQSEGWLFRKTSPKLKKSVDDFFDDFKKTEKFREIYNRYY